MHPLAASASDAVAKVVNLWVLTEIIGCRDKIRQPPSRKVPLPVKKPRREDFGPLWTCTGRVSSHNHNRDETENGGIWEFDVKRESQF